MDNSKNLHFGSFLKIPIWKTPKFAIWKILKISNFWNSKNFQFREIRKISNLKNSEKFEFGKLKKKNSVWKIPKIVNSENCKKLLFVKFQKFPIWKIPRTSNLAIIPKIVILKISKILTFENPKTIFQIKFQFQILKNSENSLIFQVVRFVKFVNFPIAKIPKKIYFENSKNIVNLDNSRITKINLFKKWSNIRNFPIEKMKKKILKFWKLKKLILPFGKSIFNNFKNYWILL